jgi:hypothetical protein
MSLNTGVLRLPNQAVGGTSDTGYSDIGFDASGNPATANAAGTVKYFPQSASAAAAAELAKLGVHGADIASAATLNLEASTGELVDVTGTTGITAITLSEGHRRIVRFTGILTLTHGASLVLLGAANITTAAGDMAVFVGYAAGVVRMAAFAKAANGIVMTGTGSLTMADSITIAAGGYITTASGGYIRTSATGFIDTAAGGSIATGTGDLTGPNASGTVALTSDITGGTLAGSFTTVNIPATTSTVGQITQAGTRILHTYGTSNLFIGPGSGRTSVMTGIENVAVGTDGALAALTTGSKNMAVGAYAGNALTTGSRNLMIGFAAMYNSAVGASDNIALGGEALRQSTGSNNIGIGPESLYGSTGSQNVGVGTNTLRSTVSGSGNTCVGGYAGYNITSGGFNVIIGSAVDAPSATASGQLNIGNVLYGTGLYQAAAPQSSTPTVAGRIGIGTATPTCALDVVGAVAISTTLAVTGVTTLTGGIIYGTYTVGTFPSTTYLEAVVTDALAPVVGVAVAAGGSAKCKVMYNGSAKIVTAVL